MHAQTPRTARFMSRPHAAFGELSCVRDAGSSVPMPWPPTDTQSLPVRPSDVTKPTAVLFEPALLHNAESVDGEVAQVG